MFVSMGPFVPAGSPAGGHSPCAGGRIHPGPGFIFRACLATLVRLPPFHHYFLFFFGFSPSFSSLLLNSCLSETLSLGPRSTVVTMATEAFLLPPC